VAIDVERGRGAPGARGRRVLPPVDDPWTSGRDLIVAAAGHAPSAMNTRPWRLRSRGRGFDLLLDEVNASRRGSEAGRQATIACGAALFNLRLATMRLGYEPVVTIPAGGDLLARIEPGARRPLDPVESDLFDAVDRRRTRRRPFERTFVPAALRGLLAATVAAEGAELIAVPPGGSRNGLDRIMAVAARLGAHDPARARGLRADWPGSRPATVEVLSTRSDEPADWLVAGQALQRLLLTATRQWVQVRFFTSALEHSELREEVRQRVTPGRYPQVVLELGQASAGSER
jgi:hypothetical protein